MACRRASPSRLCMFFGALFLGCGKRRAELARPAGGRAGRARPGARRLLARLPRRAPRAQRHHRDRLLCALRRERAGERDPSFLTVLPVVFGIARYLMLVLVQARGQDPDDLVTRDPALVGAIVAWAALCVAVLYGGLRLVPAARG